MTERRRRDERPDESIIDLSESTLTHSADVVGLVASPEYEPPSMALDKHAADPASSTDD